MFKRLATIVSLVLVCLLGGSCVPVQSFDSYLNSVIEPYRFSIARWESSAIPREVGQWISGGEEQIDDKVGATIEYFSLVERVNALRAEIEAIGADSGHDGSASLEEELDRLEGEKAALEDAVEKIIAEQITGALAEQGIFHPLDGTIGLRVNFPPVNFELERPLYLLVVSPRDRIESIREITLRQNISLEEIEDVESRVDEFGVSSLVVELGGLGVTYPTFVTNEGNLRFTIDTATEEWLHQYLAFKPLGFRYLLHLVGVSRDYEIATMNETLAGMVSREVGSMVCENWYPQCKPGTNGSQVAESEFDFNQEMREIRKAVDDYLARGQVEQAEEFMEQKRQYLASMGYYIRKLNQAYFAFHGKYADKPTSISPIGAELKELKNQYASLSDFLNTVAAMNSRQDLTVALEEVRKQ